MSSLVVDHVLQFAHVQFVHGCHLLFLCSFAFRNDRAIVIPFVCRRSVFCCSPSLHIHTPLHTMHTESSVEIVNHIEWKPYNNHIYHISSPPIPPLVMCVWFTIHSWCSRHGIIFIHSISMHHSHKDKIQCAISPSHPSESNQHTHDGEWAKDDLHDSFSKLQFSVHCYLHLFDIDIEIRSTDGTFYSPSLSFSFPLSFFLYLRIFLYHFDAFSNSSFFRTLKFVFWSKPKQKN